MSAANPDEFTTITYETDGAVATITLDRPEQANAQSMRMIDEIDRAFDLARDDDAVRVVILAANGRHFSSGHDLKELVGPEADPDLAERRSTAEGKHRHERDMYFDKCVRIYEFRKPTIAAVQGKCIAAGVMLIQQAGGRFLVPPANEIANAQPWLTPDYFGLTPELDLERSVLGTVVWQDLFGAGAAAQ